MDNSRFIKGIAGASVLFAAVAAHAQVLIEADKAATDSGQSAQTQSAREGTTPTTTRDTSSNTTQAGSSAAGSSGQSGSPQSRLQQGVMQSSERQSGTQQTGMENGRFDKGSIDSGVAHSAATQSGMSVSGATQSGTSQSGVTRRGDPANVPAPTDRSREAQDARAGITPETLRGSSGAAGTAAAGTGALRRADRAALMDMAMANMAEVEMGKIAQSKGTSEQVKSFGQQMIDDHGKALAEVQALAQAKGVTLPTALDARHRREADRLNAMSGTEFDKAYMDRAGVRDHKTVHGKLTKIESSARDPDVKAMASKMKPVVQQHLNSAQQMSQSRTTSKPDTASGNR